MLTRQEISDGVTPFNGHAWELRRYARRQKELRRMGLDNVTLFRKMMEREQAAWALLPWYSKAWRRFRVWLRSWTGI